MRKKSLGLVVISSSIFLASCGLQGEGTESRNLVADIDKVVEGARLGCNYIPTVTSIAAILGVPAAPAANELVEAICAEVEKVPQPESGRGQAREVGVVLPQGAVDGVLLPK